MSSTVRIIGRTLAALAVVAFVGGCTTPDASVYPPASGIWVEADSRPLSAGELRALERVGIDEVYVHVGTLRADGESVVLEPVGAVPPSGRGLLVRAVEVEWSTGLDPEEWSREMERGLMAGIGPTAPGWVDVGLHLDLSVPPDSDLEELGELVQRVRRQLPADRRLSASVQSALFARGDVSEVTDHLDAVVPFVYGQPPGADDEPARWDLELAEPLIERIEALGRPYLLGAHTTGSARRSVRDRPMGPLLSTSLGQLAWNSSLQLAPGFTLAGVDRQVYTFEAKRAARIDGTRFEPGDRVQVVTTSPPHLRKLVDRLGALGSEQQRGVLLRAVSAPEDRLSLSPPEIAAALGGEPLAPGLVVRLIANSETGEFQVELANESPLATDIASLDFNRLTVELDGATFRTVEVGGFQRYQLWRADADGGLVPTIRGATVASLHAPMVGGNESITSGPIALATRSPDEVTVRVRGEFLAPLGGTVELDHTFRWSEVSASTVEPPSQSDGGGSVAE